MKKMFALLLILIFAAGCSKQKKYSQDLAGTWTVYKYLLNNVDQTSVFQSSEIGYNITFTASGQFTEKYGAHSDTTIGGNSVPDTSYTSSSGTYSFTDQYSVLVLTGTSYKWVDSALVASFVKQYNIFDLTTMDVQLVTDTSRLYMVKNP